jgi:ubiquinone/menaquinone biosynthesis C-methylase UbiE
MLPSKLAKSLEGKKEYTGKLMAATREGKQSSDPANIETDRLMWEHHLYDWGKEVIFTNAAAAEIFTVYAEKGARDLCRRLKDIAGGVSGKSLLYVGSGNDRLVSLPLQAEGALMVNMDIVNESMQDLTNYGAKTCVCGDIRQLPFRDEAFDVVFSKGSLHHSRPIDEPLQSMIRVCKKGGHIVLVEPNKYMTVPRRRLPKGLAVPTPYEHHLSSRAIVKILKSNSVADVHTEAFTHAPPGTPKAVAHIWEWKGHAMPWFFKYFAFEFLVRGQKKL